MGKEVRNWSSATRFGLAFLIGVTITSTVFLSRVYAIGPWQLKWVLAPGAIVALILGFITHYGEYCYSATLLGVNAILYGLLAYIFVSLPILRRRHVRRPAANDVASGAPSIR
jgi:hypothetical protein